MDSTVSTFSNDRKSNSEKSHLARWIFALFLIVTSFGTIMLGFYHAEQFKEKAFLLVSIPDSYSDIQNPDTIFLKKEIVKISRAVSESQKRLQSLTPQEPYFIVNTTQNTFVLRSRKKILRQGLCSTGSYTLLHAGDDKQFIFKTPKGMFRIQGKVTDPVWIKPDWAFIEEGLPIPPKGSPDRYESGTLGDYAMSLGQGYLIHGTLYQRFLGMPVTHGCIRLGDDDLKAAYKALEIGSKVFIY